MRQFNPKTTWSVFMSILSGGLAIMSASPRACGPVMKWTPDKWTPLNMILNSKQCLTNVNNG